MSSSAPPCRRCWARICGRLRSRQRPDGKLWNFDAKAFRSQFKILFAELGHPSTHPYQVRHGGASHDAANELRSLAEIQARLRHATDATTKRYAKKVRYVAELGKLSAHTRQYGNQVAENLALALAGTWARAAPPSQRPGE